jgi:hypothetical protein
MSTPATIIVYGIALYAACGVVLALAFVVVGISRVQPAPVSLGARVLILPGAVALWPYVLMRWLAARGGS